jgi:hypothetical protein
LLYKINIKISGKKLDAYLNEDFKKTSAINFMNIFKDND